MPSRSCRNGTSARHAHEQSIPEDPELLTISRSAGDTANFAADSTAGKAGQARVVVKYPPRDSLAPVHRFEYTGRNPAYTAARENCAPCGRRLQCLLACVEPAGLGASGARRNLFGISDSKRSSLFFFFPEFS